MITLTRKLKKDSGETKAATSNNTSKRVSVRDKLLVKEVGCLNTFVYFIFYKHSPYAIGLPSIG